MQVYLSIARCPPLLQNINVIPVEKLFLSRFPNQKRQAGTKGVPFCPGSGNRDKKHPGAASATCLAQLFVPVGNTNRDKRSIFFPVSLFSILFLFQLYFCISIKLMYWNSVCMISTNIYIYIVTYIIFVLDSFIYKLIHLYICIHISIRVNSFTYENV